MSLFSVVIPSFNRADFLARLLESIRRQSFRDFDVVVVDDASADRQAYERVEAQFSRDFPLRFLRNKENRGAQYCRNRGIAESQGELVAFVDDDDEWLPAKLERQAAVVRASGERLGLVYAWADAVDEDGTVLERYRAAHRGCVLAELLDACFVPSPTVVVRRAVLERAGWFDESLPSCQDWDMWTRIAEAGYDVDLAQEVLALHHKHGRARIGTSPGALEGFHRCYAKHAALYERTGMTKNLSEKYRWLAHRAALAGDRDLAKTALRRSIALWKGNGKAWLRYAQLLVGGSLE